MKMMKRPQDNTLVHTIHNTLSVHESHSKAQYRRLRYWRLVNSLPRRFISPRIRRTLVKATRTRQSQCSVCVKIRPKSLTSRDYLIVLFSIVLWRGKVIMLRRKVILTNVYVFKAVFPLAVHHFTAPLRLPRIRSQSSFELVLWYIFRSLGNDRELQVKSNIIDEYIGEGVDGA